MYSTTELHAHCFHFFFAPLLAFRWPLMLLRAALTFTLAIFTLPIIAAMLNSIRIEANATGWTRTNIFSFRG